MVSFLVKNATVKSLIEDVEPDGLQCRPYTEVDRHKAFVLNHLPKGVAV